MSDHVNTTCCKRHAVELLNASLDEAELARLREENEAERFETKAARQRCFDLMAQGDTLLAALREIGGSGPVAEDIRGHRDRLQRIARAAISEVEEEKL